MADEQLDTMNFVTLVDRTGTNSEFWFDGKPFTFTGPKFRRVVPMYVADWLFRNDRSKIWTTAGDFVCRYGIQDAPEALLEVLGESAFETSAITHDTTRPDGWDISIVDPAYAQRTTINLKPNRADFAHQGGPAAPTFSGKER